MVQEFLVQAEGEVEEEMAEELSAGELQEKLKRLESLQQLQLCNEDKVTTIERSAESEEVRKALQKNPDISKERSNLLQGGRGHTPHTHIPSLMHQLHHALITQLLYNLTTSHSSHTHLTHPHIHLLLLIPSHPHTSHPHRLVSCLIHTEGQTQEDEEESQDGARPGGGPAHQQRGTAGIPRVLRAAPPSLRPPGSQTTGTT